MQVQSTTKNAAGAIPLCCDILISEEWVSAVEQVDSVSDLIGSALTICEAMGTLDNNAGHQVLFLIETAQKSLRPVRAALALGELRRIGGVA
ncbi:hypothetical protein L7D45_09020 [Brucella pseudogrignonensis]|uniref:hypothetical protein n=1 Tax=Brucella pseudogrignonensis TaxID=419475 RepID=UPI001EDBDE09|nr:hypothetical protein [Brucella pseudogrignonensis]UKK92051.1 hypothetical protein L7D45_09020 [Brucella pseudogrignonensis]